MLDIISEGFKKASDRLQGKTTLSEDNIAESLKDIRTSLLEADVAYTVVRDFLSKVKETMKKPDVYSPTPKTVTISPSPLNVPQYNPLIPKVE